MISVKSLLYNLDFKLNNLTNLEHQEIPLENKLIALNLAQLKLVKVKTSPNNPLLTGFESTNKRYHDLQNLVVPHENKKYTVKKVDNILNKSQLKVSEITPKLLFFISGYALAKKEDCQLPIYLNENITKHRDLSTVLKSSNEQPSFEYQETPVTISSDALEIYDDGSFTYSDLYVSYVRYPKRIDMEGYINLDGEESITQDCELEDYLEDELLNYAIEEITSLQKDELSLRNAMYRIKNQE
jgi:hypothetical protein